MGFSGETERCWCCGDLPTTRGVCPTCDMAGLVSPPHVCLKNACVISDEHDCEAEWAPLAPDHEILGHAPNVQP